jgi:prepilin-type N-terminal cleavage/methylation domain-containing protein
VQNPDRIRRPRGFTLLEMIVAGAMAALILAAVTLSLSQLGRAREVSAARLESSLRARAALDAIRRDVASVVRDADLFNCRVLVSSGTVSTPAGAFDRDELLLFSTRLAPIRENAYGGEGLEYETHYRVEEDRGGAALWQRRDFMPDEWPDAGGVAVPLVEGVVGLRIEAYDGIAWYDDWDSDLDGLPWALRVTVTALPEGIDLRAGDLRHPITLRTLIAIDRIVPPPQEEEKSEVDEMPEILFDEEGNPIGVAGGGGVPGGIDAQGRPAPGAEGRRPGDASSGRPAMGGGSGGASARPGGGGTTRPDGGGTTRPGGGASGGTRPGGGGGGLSTGGVTSARPGAGGTSATLGRGSRTNRIGDLRPATGPN